MELNSLIADYGIYTGSFVYCFLSAVIPVFNTEALLLGLSFLAPAAKPWLILVLASTAHMGGKTLLYFVGQGAVRVPFRRFREKLERMQERINGFRYGFAATSFLSAFAAIPPFYPYTLLAGSANVPFFTYFFPALAGISLRFALLIYFPHAVKSLLTH